MEIPPKPADLPEMGELDGKPINLKHALASLSADDLASVEVDIPGRGKVRPWRFAQRSDDVAVKDGAIVLG